MRVMLNWRERFDHWLHSGDPTPSDVAFALLCLIVFLLIAEFGLK